MSIKITRRFDPTIVIREVGTETLVSADLRFADLRYADLRYADLAGAKINWQSHDLIAEILRQSAGEDFAKRHLAGGILISRDWCYGKWLEIAKTHPLADWALDTLAAWVVEGDDAPAVLAERAKKQAVAAPVAEAESEVSA